MCHGLMVDALDSKSSVQASSPSQGNCVVFMGNVLNSHILTLPLSTQVYKWVLGNLDKKLQGWPIGLEAHNMTAHSSWL